MIAVLEMSISLVLALHAPIPYVCYCFQRTSCPLFPILWAQWIRRITYCEMNRVRDDYYMSFGASHAQCAG